MSTDHARVAGNVRLWRIELDDRQAIVERGIGLARVFDQLDRTVPDRSNRARVANGNEWRESERGPVVPALGDHLGADSSGIAEGNGKRPERCACHQPALLSDFAISGIRSPHRAASRAD